MLAVLGTGGYIEKGESILITGAAGVGKSYLATALGALGCKKCDRKTTEGLAVRKPKKRQCKP